MASSQDELNGEGLPVLRPLFSTRATIALSLVLAIPLIVRSFTNLEPYPALLFPGAGGKLTIVDGKADMSYPMLYARNAAGQLERLDERKVLAPMPPQYLWAVVGTKFGQDTSPTQTLVFRRLRTLKIPRHVPTPERRRAALSWLAARVRQLSPGATAIVWRTHQGLFDLRTGRETWGRTTEESSLQLP